ncbi:hypothetical protein HGP13_35445 [Mesorhizobium sp. NZP2077]|nr:hypothetical protein HGP13_35445 [Mesorhizobium sp. NZP2077]
MKEQAHYQKRARCFLCGDVEDRGGAAGCFESLRVIADRSPLCQGHFLLSPIKHELSFAAHLNSREATPAIRAWASALVGRSRPFLLMENGSSSNVQFCGTEHAHLHLLPSEVIVRNAPRIVDHIISRLTGDHHVSAWWPDANVMRSGNWTGYIHISSSDAKFARTIYVREPQQRQLSRSAVAAAIGKGSYLYDETVDLTSARRTTAQLRAGMERLVGASPADITLIEGLSGSGKSSVVSSLTAADGHLAIRTGATFCALAKAYGEAVLSATPNDLVAMLLGLNEPQMPEPEIDEPLRSRAAAIAADGKRWRAVMDWLWEQTRVARPFVEGIVVEGRGFEDSRFRGVGNRYYLNAPESVRAARTAGRIVTGSGSLRDYTDQNRLVGRTSPGSGTVIETGGKSVAEICEQITALTARKRRQKAHIAASFGSLGKRLVGKNGGV